MDRCIISSNVSGYTFGREGLGGGIFGTNSITRNSLIAGNWTHNGDDGHTEGSVPGYGGGVYLKGGSLLDCTVTGNQTGGGAGGIFVGSAMVRNSIVYFNSSPSDANWCNAGSGAFDHSCTTPDPGGAGNLMQDPQFADRASGNYRLRQVSPCIDAGINEPWMNGAADLDGNPRIRNGVVDLGAWEMAANYPPPVITGISTLGGNVVILRGHGVAGATYYVLASTNAALPWTNWTVLAKNVFDGTGQFVFTNAIDPHIPHRFYLLREP